jgi:hypothetical protein
MSITSCSIDHKWISSVLLLPSDLPYSSSLTKTGLTLIRRLEKEGGFDVHLLDSNYKNKFVVAILSLPAAVLQRKAAEMMLPTPTNSRTIWEIVGKLGGTQLPTPLGDFLPHGDHSRNLESTLFLPYNIALDNNEPSFYQTTGISGGVGTLQEPLRQVVVDEVLENMFGMSNLIKEGIVIDCFPPHDEKRQLKLWRFLTASYPAWALHGLGLHCTPQLCGLRDYIGKHTALYCVFIMTVPFFHLPATLIGVGLAGMTRGQPSPTLGAAGLGLIMPLVGFLSMRLWRRHEAQVACNWNAFSRDSLKLGLPMSHSYFSRAHLHTGADAATRSVDQGSYSAPASTLPLRYTGRARLAEKQYAHKPTESERAPRSPTRESTEKSFVESAMGLMGPTSPIIALTPQTLVARVLRSTVSLFCTIIALLLIGLISVLTYVLVRSVCVVLLGSLASNRAYTLDLPLAVHVLFVLSARESFDSISLATTHLLNARTARTHHASLLWRRVALELACWLGPSVYSIALQRRLDGTKACFFKDNCAATLGRCALYVVVGHIIGEVFFHYVWPQVSNGRRRAILKMSDITMQRLHKRSLLAQGTSRISPDKANAKHSLSTLLSDQLGEAWCNPLLSPRATHTTATTTAMTIVEEEGLPTKTSTTPAFSSGQQDVAIAAEKEFLTLMKSATPDRDVDSCSTLSPHYAVTVGFVVRWTMVWAYSAVAPSVGVWCTLYQGVELLLAAHKEVFLRRRALSPSTQYLGVDPAAIDLLSRISIACFVVVAYFLCFYVDGGRKPTLVSALVYFTSDSLFTALLLISAALCLAICELLPCVPDGVIMISLQNEYIWRRIKAVMFPSRLQDRNARRRVPVLPPWGGAAPTSPLSGHPFTKTEGTPSSLTNNDSVGREDLDIESLTSVQYNHGYDAVGNNNPLIRGLPQKKRSLKSQTPLSSSHESIEGTDLSWLPLKGRRGVGGTRGLVRTPGGAPPYPPTEQPSQCIPTQSMQMPGWVTNMVGSPLYNGVRKGASGHGGGLSKGNSDREKGSSEEET